MRGHQTKPTPSQFPQLPNVKYRVMPMRPICMSFLIVPIEQLVEVEVQLSVAAPC